VLALVVKVSFSPELELVIDVDWGPGGGSGIPAVKHHPSDQLDALENLGP